MSVIGAKPIKHTTAGFSESVNKAVPQDEEEQKKKMNPNQVAYCNSIFGNGSPQSQTSGIQA